MEKGGSKCSNPSSGGFEQDVTNFKNAALSLYYKKWMNL